MAWLQVVCVAAVCAAVAGSPMTKGYSYPVPDNGLYLPPPPDKGGPVNPGGSDNTEVKIVPPKNDYLPPSLVPDGSGPPGGRVPFPTTTTTTTRRPTTRRVYTTTRRPVTTRRVYTTPRPTTRRPTTTRRVYTTPRPTTRRPVITRRPSTAAPKAAPSGHTHMGRPYEFGYDIADDQTDNAFSQKETSDGMIITGEYRWDMPDGRTQIVTYLADWAKGYYPTVRYVPTDSL